MKITAANLYAIAPSARSEYVEEIVANQNYLEEAGIMAHRNILDQFIAHIMNETGALNRIEENLYYTSAGRLMAVWPARFKTAADAAPFVRQPQKLANNVYGNRNGNTEWNDGWWYRGSGPLQTTFKGNFAEVERESGLPVVANPDMLRMNMKHGLKAAAIFWKVRPKLIETARNDDLVGTTRIVNGGQTGIHDRRTFLNRAKKVNWGQGGAAPAQDFLRKGDDGPRVRQMQERLQAHGFYLDGRLDGDFGDGTELEVVAFQKARGLVPDGVIGPLTRDKLNEQAVKDPPAPVAPVPPPPDVEPPRPRPVPVPPHPAPEPPPSTGTMPGPVGTAITGTAVTVGSGLSFGWKVAIGVGIASLVAFVLVLLARRK